jgi:hypothetical protein
MTDIDFTDAPDPVAVIRRALRETPPPVTAGIYADFAWAIVDAHNAEGRDLDALSFVRYTAHCSLSQRTAVALELPPWAQRRVSIWDDEAAA